MTLAENRPAPVPLRGPEEQIPLAPQALFFLQLPLGITPTPAPGTPTPTPVYGGGPGCAAWKYQLRWELPSRLAIIKNALGGSVNIYPSYTGPGADSGQSQSDWPNPTTTSSTWNYSALPGYVGGGGIAFDFLQDAQRGTYAWEWTITFGNTSNGTIYGPDPGEPFYAFDETPGEIAGITGSPCSAIAGNCFAITPGTWTSQPAQDVVGLTQNLVNWGMLSFNVPNSAPGTTDSELCLYPLDYNWIQHIDPTGATGVAAIEAAMALFCPSGGCPSSGGIHADGGTPSVGGLLQAKQEMINTFTKDPKNFCPRLYGLILTTDGQSNICNPVNSVDNSPVTGQPNVIGQNWVYAPGAPFPQGLGATGCLGVYPAPQCFDPASPAFGFCCDDPGDTGGDNGNPGNDCVTNYAGSYLAYPPGAAEQIYNLNLQASGNPSNPVINPHTFVIGISDLVSTCELNYTAYRGRTDASDTAGLGGLIQYNPAPTPTPAPVPTGTPGPTPTPVGGCTTQGDMRLPWVGQNGTSPDNFGTNCPGANCGTKPYAFFPNPNNPKQLADIFTYIASVSAAGDYSTSAPVAGGVSGGSGSDVFLASADYPSWRGHLRHFSTATSSPTLLWDAGDVLTNPPDATYPTPATRLIYTWDPSNSNALVPVDTSHQAQLATIAGDPGFSSNVIDFIRGNDGTLTNTARLWMLGPSINVTPAVSGPPPIYKQRARHPDHLHFETQYSGRATLVFAGANDGMLHAFNFGNGAEVLALIPPNLLTAQETLYQNFTNNYGQNGNPTGSCAPWVTGQDPSIPNQVWGIGNSVRYTDVYDSSITYYRTVAYLTEGPGGKTLAAIDITHPSPTDPNYDSTSPVTILWAKNGGTDIPGLFNTWSVPALSAANSTQWLMFFGQGENPASTAGGQQNANFFTAVDPLSGNNLSGGVPVPLTLPLLSSPAPLVGQQSFADSVFFEPKAKGFAPDNVANLALEADLNGRIWFNYSHAGIQFDQASVGIDATAYAGQPQPIYFSPGANGLQTSGCQLYAFGSGNIYEMSAAVSGSNVNSGGAGQFTPSVYLAVNTQTSPPFSAQVPDSQILQIPVDTLPVPAPGTGTVGIHTQVTSSPLLLVSLSGLQSDLAFFSVYDPDQGCTGESYIVQITINPRSDCTGFTGSPTIVTYDVGPGATSGFVISGQSVYAGFSGLGSSASAGLLKVPISLPKASGLPSAQPVWWKEIK